MSYPVPKNENQSKAVTDKPSGLSVERSVYVKRTWEYLQGKGQLLTCDQMTSANPSATTVKSEMDKIGEEDNQITVKVLEITDTNSKVQIQGKTLDGSKWWYSLRRGKLNLLFVREITQLKIDETRKRR